jgi:hypothetical protein
MATIETATTPAQGSPAPSPGLGSSPRELLVRKLIDIVVLPAARISANERALAADVLLQIVDKVEEPIRVEIGRRIARVAEAPPALVRMLLLDEPGVAQAVIRGADSLPEALLIECAREGETAHRECLARRIDLTTSVADAILSFNEPEIAKLLLKREQFALSPSAIDILVARSTTDHDLQALLLRRRELEPAHGFMMFWWVGAEQRRRILARFALSRTLIQDALDDLYPRVFRSNEPPDPFVKEILVMLERRHRPRGVNGEAVSMDVVRKTLAAARTYPAQEIVHAVGMIAGVSRELAARILRDPGGEPFAVMCKGLGLPRDDFYSIMMVDPDADEPARAKKADATLAVFDSIARDFARAVLRYWDWDGNPRIARITRLLGVDDETAL